MRPAISPAKKKRENRQWQAEGVYSDRSGRTCAPGWPDIGWCGQLAARLVSLNGLSEPIKLLKKRCQRTPRSADYPLLVGAASPAGGLRGLAGGSSSWQRAMCKVNKLMRGRLPALRALALSAASWLAEGAQPAVVYFWQQAIWPKCPWCTLNSHASPTCHPQQALYCTVPYVPYSTVALAMPPTTPMERASGIGR